MQHILSETAESANAEAGVLYLVSNDEKYLEELKKQFIVFIERENILNSLDRNKRKNFFWIFK